jgi:hypothetical protein
LHNSMRVGVSQKKYFVTFGVLDSASKSINGTADNESVDVGHGYLCAA